MFLVLLVCIKLYVLTCVAAACSGNQITLLESPDMDMQWNKKFKMACGLFYDINIVTIHSNNVGAILNAMRKHTNVINLSVPDFYNHNHIDLLKQGLVYAGDQERPNEYYEYIQESMHCSNVTVNGKPTLDCQPKNIANIFPPNVKLVQDTVLDIDSGVLFDFIRKMELKSGKLVHTPESCLGWAEHYCEWNVVLVCMDQGITYEPMQDYISKSTLQFKVINDTTDCGDAIRKSINKLLTVLAPRHFDYDNELHVPVMFYETSFISPKETARFPNSAVLAKWENLKYAFIKFLRKMDWRKVGVLSDSSLYSHEFEKAITQLFRQNNIMYKVIGCEYNNCKNGKFDASSALLTFDQDNIGIIIANMDTENILSIPFHLSRRRITWLFREWDWRSHEQWPTELTRNAIAYSISIGPATDRNNTYEQFSESHGDSQHVRILHSIDYINWTFGEVLKYNTFGDDTRRKQFFSAMMKQMEDGTKLDKSMAYVVDKNRRLVASMYIKGGQADIVEFHGPPRLSTDVPGCSIISNDYNRSCDEEVVLQIMFVIVTFSLMLLLITVYFHRTSPIRASNYVHL